MLPDLASVTARNEGKRNGPISALFIRSYIALLHDTPLAERATVRTTRIFESELRNGIKPVIARFAELADRILASCVYTSDDTVTGVYIPEMKTTPVFKEYLVFHRTGDPAVLKFLLSFLWFGKKMDYENESLRPAALRKWVEKERVMGDMLFEKALTDALKKILRFLLEDFDDSVRLPKLGSGVNSDVKNLQIPAKIDKLCWDKKLGYTFRAFSKGRMLRTVDFPGDIREMDNGQVSELNVVPKSYKAVRTVCYEPVTYMYFQQEVMRWFVESIRRSPIGAMVDLRTQERNRNYALVGSYNYNVDTVDLSDASDSVHIDMVRRIFSPGQLTYLLGTRSDRVRVPAEIGGNVVTVKKFAPMGSATCFPTQCAIFSAITILGYLMHSCQLPVGGDLTTLPLDDGTLKELLASMSRDPSHFQSGYVLPVIYGDDIACDSKVTGHVLDLLARSGFTVNTSKSFTGGQMIRESCGIYCYDGHDVSPTLFRASAFKTGLDAEAFSSLIQQINHAGDNRLFNLRSTLIDYLLNEADVSWRGNALRSRAHDGSPLQGFSPNRLAKYPILREVVPFVTDRDQFGVYTTVLQKDRYWNRVNGDTQLEEIMTLGLVGLKGDAPTEACTSYFLDQWQRARVREGSTEVNFSASRIRPSLVRVELGWTPVRIAS